MSHTLEKKFSTVTNDRYRPEFHLAPTYGWMNDPNGFVYFQGYYHIFYQNYPYKPEWGPMHWGHARSRDLMHWEDLPIALTPGDDEDTDGVFSGSAIVKDGRLWLIYTGHHYYGDNDPEHFWQNQNLAYSDDGVHFTKYEHNPIIAEAPSDSTHHFRDPKIWEYDGNYNVILGNQSQDGLGRALIYQSENLFDWQYLGELDKSRAVATEGDMWECPDFFTLNGRHILLTSPMKIETQPQKFRNLYQTGYFVGHYDYAKNQFDRGEFKELDNGHDFYASQTLLAPDGRRIVIGWADMWESEFPEKTDGWAGMLTLPRELILANDRLLMRPVAEVRALREQVLSSGSLSSVQTLLDGHSSTVEVQLNLTDQDFNLHFQNSKKQDIITLDFDHANQQFRLTHQDHPQDDRFATIAQSSEITLSLYIDKSVVEIFVQNGEKVFTERVYTDDAPIIKIDGKNLLGQFTTYQLETH
ncbi:glycoside hydrolase family 32 protein (plasmid) [Leuconostoc mesenteroides]|uniref:glycoside hydrolase family 32 protein n=1 Tax=Leuconostoc TaxID=1243 RepID=UPI000DAADB90|nr:MULTISPECIES: glycoside hydrolase family 32 protein [Leuconostoc]AWV38889.1 sucrose-6-phosphate hydrolase [Leuconostoc mesenteroides]MCU4665909.1 glycoside hydrolase family 32 protein [Leuconostoc mesenteroides]QAT28666.1 glycoside hydrolase family 32 protein [Leuconostoc mesenteroides]QEA37582.1 glycoside hydrolase family 32 protein [Leuconostoc citreum]